MENISPSVSPARRGPAPQGGPSDWRPAQGIIDRMLAYRDWWNLPEGRRKRGTGKAPDRAQARAGAR